MRKLLFLTLFLFFISLAPQAQAVSFTLDLNDGSFVTLPQVGGQTIDYTGIYASPTFDLGGVVIGPAGTLNVWINFLPGQSLTLTDAADNGVPQEGILFDVVGSGNTTVNPIIRLSGATGIYRTSSTDSAVVNDEEVFAYLGSGEAFQDGTTRFGEFSSDFPNDPAFVFGGRDIVNDSLSFTGVHLEIFNQGSEMTVDQLSFLAVGNTVTANTEPIPEPSTFLLFGSGLAGLLGWQRWRTKAL